MGLRGSFTKFRAENKARKEAAAKQPAWRKLWKIVGKGSVRGVPHNEFKNTRTGTFQYRPVGEKPRNIKGVARSRPRQK